MKIRKTALILVILVFSAVVFATFLPAEVTTKASAGSITWNKYDAGLKLAAKSKKPIMVDFYTDWCGWCKKLDKNTYTDTAVANYLNSHFVSVKINGESRENLDLPTGPSNGLNVARSFGVKGYPCIWFLNADGSRINNLSGYRPPDIFIYYLKYVGEGI
jgi:thioredoxin-related protein